MDSVITALNNILAWFGGLPAWIMQLFKDLLSSAYDMLGDVAAFILDKIMLGVISLLDLIPVSTSFNANQYMAGAPAEFIGMLIAIRVPEALAILAIALGIRFLLGLIPFIRVGG